MPTRRALLASAALAPLVARGASTAAREVTPAAIDAIETIRDVVYGTVDGEALIVDVVRPTTREGLRPAVILIHGGGLVEGSRTGLLDAGDALAQAGYVTFNIEYRLFSRQDKTNPWPAQLDDAQRAVRWIRANAATYGIDPERVGAFGYSSGGQLAAFLGTRDTRDHGDPALAAFSSRVSCVATLGGTFDMSLPYPNAGYAAVDAEILGGTGDAPPDAAVYRDFSPITFVDETSAPFLIFQEGEDSIVPIEHSRRMVAALQAAEVEVVYAWFPDYDHGTWLSWSSEAAETLAFFGRHLTPEWVIP